MRSAVWFVLGASISATTLSLAAPGDLIYMAHESVSITGPQAASIADAFITAGAWTGDRADMRNGCAYRAGDGKFYATVSGIKTATSAALAADVAATGRNAEVLGVVE